MKKIKKTTSPCNHTGLRRADPLGGFYCVDCGTFINKDEIIKTKDDKIIKDAKENNIPIFVLTAKDKNSTDTLYNYHTNCGDCSAEHLQAIVTRIEEFEEWQGFNPDKVKLPD
jgi:hypothetical protein